MRRFGTPEDLLGTLLWLVDDHMSAFVTGVTIPVDGGFMAYSGVKGSMVTFHLLVYIIYILGS